MKNMETHKKTEYITPEIEVIILNGCDVITESPPDNEGEMEEENE